LVIVVLLREFNGDRDGRNWERELAGISGNTLGVSRSRGTMRSKIVA
jgi:hypothetical protein